MDKYEESESDFTINRFKLEEEAEKQPALMRHYSREFSIWAAKVKEIKRRLEYTQAVHAEIIRTNPKEYGIKKDSDKVVFALALEEEDYKIIHQEYIEALKMEGYYESAVQSLKQKGSMLKDLIQLWLNNYYSASPITGKEGKNPKHKLRIIEDNI